MFKFIRSRGSANQATMGNHFIPVVVIASGRWDYLMSHWWNAVTEDLSTVPAASKKTQCASEETWKKYYSGILITKAHFLWFLSLIFFSYLQKNKH